MGERSGDPNSVNAALGQLREELDTIRTKSRDSVLSTPEFTQGAMNLKNTLIAQGVDAKSAGQIGIGEESEFSNDKNLAGRIAAGAGDLMGSASGQSMMRTFGGLGNDVPANLPPQLTEAYLSHQPGGADKLKKASDATLKYLATSSAKMYRGDDATFLMAVYNFQLMAGSIEPSLLGNNLSTAIQLFTKLTGIERPDSGDGADSSSGGGSGGGGVDSSPAPVGGGPKAASTPGGGGSGGGGVQQVHVGQGNVQITLTPEASRLLKVQGPNPAPLTPLQQGANRGQADSYVNGSS